MPRRRIRMSLPDSRIDEHPGHGCITGLACWPGHQPRRDAMTSTNQDAAPSVTMRTVLVTWTEISQHTARVQVPVDADTDDLDLENRLAELDNDGFQGLEREIQSVVTVEHDPDAEVLVPLDEATSRRARLRP